MRSQTQPAKSNGYIYWEKAQANLYLVKIYQSTNNNLSLIQTDTVSTNYYQFNAPQLLSSDLYYTISALDRNDIIIGTSDPASINPDCPPPSPLCWIDCDGKKESYRLYQMQTSNGGVYLMASNEAGANLNTGVTTPYYQAIDMQTYDLLDDNHPYKKGVINSYTNVKIYDRSHIPINLFTPGGPFKDANNNAVANGWLVEKRMDKYAHFNSSNTGTYEGMDSWCNAMIQNATLNFNQNLVPSTLMPVSSEQNEWFLAQIGTNPNGTPIYLVPQGMECTQLIPGSSSGVGSLNLNNYYINMVNCWDLSGAGTFDPIDCIVNGFDDVIDDTISGVTFESMDYEVQHFLSIENRNGAGNVKHTTGEFRSGLYKIVTFMKSGKIIPTYLELGNEVDYKDILVDIYPNAISGNTLKFVLQSESNAEIDIIVQKLDGTMVYTETLNLLRSTPVQREIPVTGDIPYKQLRVSIVLPNGTVIQKIALSE